MPSNLAMLENWFPSGTAEGERAILEQVFVYVDELKRVMAPKPGNPYLLIGRKGTGKSAIVEFAVKLLELERVPSIILRPHDINTTNLTENDSMGDQKRKFYELLVSSIAAKLVECRNTLLTGDNAILYEEPVRTGNRSPDFIGKLARSLSNLAKPMTQMDFAAAIPALTPAASKEIEDTIASRLGNKRFHIFINYTDQVANPERIGHLNRIWALLLAARELSSQIPEICSVITLREEIWQRLRNESAAQRDQTDHFANLVINTSSSDHHVQKVIEVRLKAAAKQCDKNEGPYSTFFQNDYARAPKSPDSRTWKDLILVRSRQRPRDAIQLIARLADHALHNKKIDKIDESTFHAVMPAFSEERASLFSQEVDQEFPAAMDVIRSFANVPYNIGGFKLTTEEAKAHMSSLIGAFRIEVYGRTMHQQNVDDVFEIWRFLYNSNFLNARISDEREKDGFRHLIASDNPTLVSKSRWNEMQGIIWEINPAFRDYLILRQEEQANRIGLPLRKPRRGSRRRR